MQTYADVCRRVLTYAEVCGRLLTYADVCRCWTFRAAASHSVLWKGSVATGALLVPPLPAAASSAVPDAQHASGAGAQFTCFTGTKVQRLTRQERSCAERRRAWCRRLRPRPRAPQVYSVYLLYWYKSANSDATATPACPPTRGRLFSVLSLLALLVQEYKY